MKNSKKMIVATTLMLIGGLVSGVYAMDAEEERKDEVAAHEIQHADDQKKEVNQRLLDAVKARNVHKVEVALSEGADSDAADMDGSALHYAVCLGRGEIVKMLLNKGAQIDFISDVGQYTPLHTAVCSNCVEMVKMLLERGASVDPISKKGNTPLHTAVFWELREIVAVLMKAGADPYIVSEHGRGKTAFDLATEDIREVMMQLANESELVREQLSSELVEAIKEEEVEVVVSLLERKAMVGEKEASVFEVTSPEVLRAMTDRLLTRLNVVRSEAAIREIKVDLRGLLVGAVSCGCSDVVEKLIEHKGDVNATHGLLRASLLHTAIHQRHSEFVTLLLQKGALVNAKNVFGYTPLHQIAERCGNDLKTVQALLDYKADVTIKGKTGWTPLHFAARSGYAGMVRMLIGAGAQVNAIDKEIKLGRYALRSKTPLHQAVQQGRVEAVKVLVEAEADCTITDEDGKTVFDIVSPEMVRVIADALVARLKVAGGARAARESDSEVYKLLICAIDKGRIDIVERLLVSDLDITLTGSLGHILLRTAASTGRLKMAKLLLKRGVNVNAKNEHGMTPLHYAAMSGFAEMAEMLIAAGADLNSRDEDGNTAFDVALPEVVPVIMEALVAETKRAGSVAMVQRVISDLGSALSNAANKRDQQMVPWLLRLSVKADENGGNM